MCAYFAKRKQKQKQNKTNNSHSIDCIEYGELDEVILYFIGTHKKWFQDIIFRWLQYG